MSLMFFGGKKTDIIILAYSALWSHSSLATLFHPRAASLTSFPNSPFYTPLPTVFFSPQDANLPFPLTKAGS